MASRFEGSGVLVTGGAAGMGRAIAEAFVAEGADVVLADIDGERVAQDRRGARRRGQGRRPRLRRDQRASRSRR